jgi:hypothetical protein
MTRGFEVRRRLDPDAMIDFVLGLGMIGVLLGAMIGLIVSLLLPRICQ